MKPSDTPETDAFARAMYSSGVDQHCDGAEALKHARALERQRDEAIATSKIAAGEIVALNFTMRLADARSADQIKSLSEQRDAALAKLAEIRNIVAPPTP